jgi:SAM-dependent methyltransferase
MRAHTILHSCFVGKMKDYRSKWERAYRSQSDLWGTAPSRGLVRFVEKYGFPRSALDFGCGTGRNAQFLASGGTRVVAVDFSPSALAVASRLPMDGAQRVRFTRSMSHLRQPRFDCVLCLGVLHGYPPRDAQRIIASLCKHLKAGGMLLVSFFERPPRQEDVSVLPSRVSASCGGQTFSVWFHSCFALAEWARPRVTRVFWRCRKNKKHGANILRSHNTVYCLTQDRSFVHDGIRMKQERKGGIGKGVAP